MKKGWRNRLKGKSHNAKQRAAAENRRVAAEAATEAYEAQRAQEAADGASPLRAHVPEKVGKGGMRQKVDTDKLTPRSKTRLLDGRKHGAAHRLKKQREQHRQEICCPCPKINIPACTVLARSIELYSTLMSGGLTSRVQL